MAATMARHRMIIPTVGISLMAVMSAVSGLNVALPTMAIDTGATQTQLTWIVDSYTVVFAGLLLLAGAIGDRYGRRMLLAVGLIIFGTASAFGLFVTDPTHLMMVRIAMGVGAAAVMPSTLSVITTSFDGSERGKAVSIWVAIAGGGAILGLFGSALLLEWFSWNSFFALNSALALIGLLGTLVFIRESRDDSIVRLDWIGGVISIVAVASLVFGIIEGPENGWTAGITVAALAMGLLGLVAWVLWELRVEHPLLDPRLFRNRGFSAGSLSVTLQFFVQFGFIFVGVQYLQFVAGFSALEAAVRLLPMAFVLMISARVTGQVNKTIPQKYLGAIGMTIMAIGMLMLARLGSDFNQTWFFASEMVFGLGVGLAATPATTAITSSLPDEKQGVASAVNDTTRELGSAMGIAILGAALTSGYQSGMQEVTAGLPATIAEKLTGSIAFTQMQPPPQLAAKWDLLLSTAYSSFADGMTYSLTIAAAVSILGAIAIFLIAPTKRAIAVVVGDSVSDVTVAAEEA